MVNPYDEVPFVGYPFPQTHPDRLATLATLFGMKPAPVESCSVLELGCGDGGNLIPMAYQLPGARFAGVDAAAKGIDHGRALVDTLGLRNISLRHDDIMSESAAPETYDFIIAHGVYSWVPPAVQARILDICRRNLAPQGVAFVSYNVFPGGHLRRMIGEMLKYHVRRFAEPEQQIEQARGLIGFLASRPAQDAYGLLLAEELESLVVRRAEGLFHDELADINSPSYFHDFADQARSHGLQYLAEADFFEMQDLTEAQNVRKVLQHLGKDLIEREQYLDFLKCRRFRQTLLCHENIKLNRQLRSEQVREYWIGAAGPPPQTRTGGDDGAVQPSGNLLEQPFATAMFTALADSWPHSLRFDALVNSVRAQIGVSPEDDVLLTDAVLAAFASGKLQLHVHAPRLATQLSEQPVASAVARLQAAKSPTVTNLLHRNIYMEDPLGRGLLAALDGAHDRRALLDHLVGLVDSGSIAIPDLQDPVTDSNKARAFLEGDLDRSLRGLAKCALLEA